jgi:hypothetical protein
MLSDKSVQAQKVLDRIHAVSKRIGRFAVTKKVTTSRLFYTALRDLDEISNRLFATAGNAANTLMEEITEIEESLSRFLKPEEDKRIDDSHTSAEASEGGVEGILEILRQTVEKVRVLERSWEFQLQLWNEKKDLCKQLDCSTDQFTYGSSSFATWKKVACSPCFRRAMHAGAKAVIFGSSTGLLAFYTSALYPQSTCVGYEVAPSLHAHASKLCKEFPVANIEFRLEDMLTANITDANIVILTSLCWDEITRQSVAVKLAKELLPGSVVIDYRDSTFSIVPLLDMDRSHYSPSLVPARFTKSNEGPVECHADKTHGKTPDGHRGVKALRKLYSPHDLFAKAELGNMGNSENTSGMNACIPSSSTYRPYRVFKLGGIVQGVCSWNDAQRIYLYECYQ